MLGFIIRPSSVLKLVVRVDVGPVLRTDESEDGGQKEDGVQHPEDDDEKHDLEEGKEDIGGGGGEDDDAEEGGRGSVQDGCSGVSDGVLRSVLTRHGVGHQVSGTHVGREVDGEAHAHDEMDHRDGGQRQVPEVHEAEDAHQDHDDGEDHQQDHEDVRQEEEGDDRHDGHSAAHHQQGGGQHGQELFKGHEGRVVGKHGEGGAISQVAHSLHHIRTVVLIVVGFCHHKAARGDYVSFCTVEHDVSFKLWSVGQEDLQAAHKCS